MNLAKRSYQEELLDSDSIPFEDIRQNMKELEIINEWLGGHSITISGFNKLAGDKKSVSVCEIGCGGGDNLNALARWCKRKEIELTVIGIDIKRECTDLAKRRGLFATAANWITNDYRNVAFQTKPDIIFSSLFCHHFTDRELADQFKWMKNNAALGFFVNDLQRNTLAYHAIALLTTFFSKSYLVKNDAPLSVARGFTRKELHNICKEAELDNVKINWKWAFRYLVLMKYDQSTSI